MIQEQEALLQVCINNREEPQLNLGICSLSANDLRLPQECETSYRGRIAKIYNAYRTAILAEFFYNLR